MCPRFFVRFYGKDIGWNVSHKKILTGFMNLDTMILDVPGRGVRVVEGGGLENR